MELTNTVRKSEIKDVLKSLYTYRIEAHAHTNPASPCSQITPDKMVKTYKKLGFDAVVLTNHFVYYLLDGMTKQEAIDHYLRDYEECKRLGDEQGIKFYLGAEVRFDHESINDYLLYGVDREIIENIYDYLDKDLVTFRSNVKLEKSVFLQAHPFRNGMEQVDPSLIDGIETFNLHPGHNSRIGIATRFAKECGFDIMTAGSDFHHPDQGHEGVGAIRTKILPRDSFEFAEILKSGDYLFEVGENSIVLP